MKIFVTGASGYIGSHLVPILIANGHTVTGLARSDASAEKIKALGATPHSGSLKDLESLRSGAKGQDAVIHLGFIHDFQSPDHDFMGNCATDSQAVLTLAEALGPGKILINTSGTLTGDQGVVSFEEPHHGFTPRPDNFDKLKDVGVIPIIIRLSPTVHGPGDKGFISGLISPAKQHGFAAYPGDGQQRWSAVHVDDAAELYALAIEKGQPGFLHGAAEEGVTKKDIAEAIAKRLNIPAKSISLEEAATHFGFLSRMVTMDRPTGNRITKEKTGWNPKGLGLLEDIATSETYFA